MYPPSPFRIATGGFTMIALRSVAPVSPQAHTYSVMTSIEISSASVLVACTDAPDTAASLVGIGSAASAGI